MTDIHSLSITLDGLAQDLGELIATDSPPDAWRDLEKRVEVFCKTLASAPPETAQGCRATLGDMITQIESHLAEPPHKSD